MEVLVTMGILDALKGVFESDLVQGALESTPIGDLGEQVGSRLGDAAGAAESVGIDAGQMTEMVPGAEALSTDLGGMVQDAVPLEGVEPPVP